VTDGLEISFTKDEPPVASIHSLSWGVLLEGTPFASAFPDRRVPLRSPWPIVPREEGAPRCYIVEGRLLSEQQVSALAHSLLEQWGDECSGLDEAIAYVRSGLPLRTTWFSVVGTSRMGLINLP
jgi:hypothetical protein